MIVILVSLNVVGVTEAAKLSISLAVVDFATQMLLVILGFVLVFSPEILRHNVIWGVAPTWSNLAISIPIAMLAYTGVETVSNLAEEARDPVETVPNAYKLVAVAVFAIYFTLPMIALSALPVKEIDGQLTTLLALPPEDGGYSNDPILGLVENIGLEGRLLDGLEIYVGILAATILFVATNAGVIGASRITYSMASYRQIPEVFRRLHPKFKTPWLSLVVFAGIAPILILLPGRRELRRHALLARGDALVHGRPRIPRADSDGRPDAERSLLSTPRAPTCGSAASTGRSSRSSAALATGISFLVIVAQSPATRWVGLGWIVSGLVFYVVYRRRVVKASLRETVKAPPAFGPALALEYRRLLVPVVAGQPSDDALDVACSLAAERGARIVALNVLEVPLGTPLEDDLHELEDAANAELDEAIAIGDSYGVRVLDRLVRARSAGPAIVDEAERRGSEIIVIGTPRKSLTRSQKAVFGRTVDYVLRHAPCRVMVTASREKVPA